MDAPVTALYVAIAALLVCALAFNVVRLRRQLRVGIGDGGSADLGVAIRAHANAVEHLPIALLLLLLLELNGAAPVLLHLFGVVILGARTAHAEGLLRHGSGRSKGRFHGTLWTWVVMVTMAATLLIIGVM